MGIRLSGNSFFYQIASTKSIKDLDNHLLYGIEQKRPGVVRLTGLFNLNPAEPHLYNRVERIGPAALEGSMIGLIPSTSS